MGNLRRIDFFLDSFDKYLLKLTRELDTLEKNQTSIRKELSRKESYAEQIETYKAKVEELDRALGVNQL